MIVQYHPGTDLLYLRFDERQQQVVNRQVSEGVVLDIGEGDRIVGVEILGASMRLDLSQVLPVRHQRPRRRKAVQKV